MEKFIDLKTAGASFNLLLRAYDAEDEEVPRLVLGQDAEGQSVVSREPWQFSLPLGSTLGGPRLTEEVLGPYLWARYQEMREEARRQILAQMETTAGSEAPADEPVEIGGAG